MSKFTKTALASGVLALVIAGGFGLQNLAQADERGSYSSGKRMAHAEGDRGSHRGRGRHRGGRHHGRRRGRKGMRRVRNMMELYDTNGDRKLTKEEIQSGRQSQIDKFDRDDSGSISIQEFAPLWAEMRKRRIVRRFQRIDKNGDGQITKEEFVDPAVRMVERLDRNGDGAISREDRRRRGRGFWRRNRGGDDNRPQREGGEQEAPKQQ